MRSWFVCFVMVAFVAVCMAVGTGKLLADGGGSSVSFTPLAAHWRVNLAYAAGSFWSKEFQSINLFKMFVI